MQILLITIEYMFVRRLFGDVDEITLALAKTILDELDIDMDGFLQPGEFDKGGRNIHLFIYSVIYLFIYSFIHLFI